jgi:hypothetical protein
MPGALLFQLAKRIFDGGIFLCHVYRLYLRLSSPPFQGRHARRPENLKSVGRNGNPRPIGNRPLAFLHPSLSCKPARRGSLQPASVQFHVPSVAAHGVE